jgi:hypothetical protein
MAPQGYCIQKQRKQGAPMHTQSHKVRAEVGISQVQHGPPVSRSRKQAMNRRRDCRDLLQQPQLCEHDLSDRLDQQPRAERPRRLEPFDDGDAMPVAKQQRGCRGSRHPTADDADVHGPSLT